MTHKVGSSIKQGKLKCAITGLLHAIIRSFGAGLAIASQADYATMQMHALTELLAGKLVRIHHTRSHI